MGYFRDRELELQNPSWWELLSMWFTVPVFVFLIYAWNSDRDTAKRQKTAAATIVAEDTSNHDCLKYVFSVESASYSGCEFPDHPAIGGQVLVFYDPQDPSRNHLEDFETVGNGRLPIIPIPILMLFATVAYIWIRRRSYRIKQERITRESHLKGS
jgi:hypothetical protein